MNNQVGWAPPWSAAACLLSITLDRGQSGARPPHSREAPSYVFLYVSRKKCRIKSFLNLADLVRVRLSRWADLR